MPWLTIILSVLAFLLTKSSTGSTAKAALTAALVGAGSYTYTHSDYAAGSSLAELDGIPSDPVPMLDSAGNPVLNTDGTTMTVAPGTSTAPDGTVLSTTADVLKSWGGVGTAAVVGTTAVAASGGTNLKSLLPWALGGVGLYLLVK